MQDSDKLSDVQKLSQLMDGEWHDLNQSECVQKLCADRQLQEKWSRYHLIRDALNNESMQLHTGLASRISAAIEEEPEYTNITPFGGATSGLEKHDGGEGLKLADTAEQMQIDAHGAYDSHDDASGTNERQWQSESTVSASESALGSTSAGKSLFNTGVTGFALAASVALITVVGMNLYESQAPVQQGASLASSTASTDAQSGNPGVQAFTVASQAGSDAFSQQVEGAPLPVVDLVSNSGVFWVSPDSSRRVADEQRLNKMLSRHLDNSPTSSREGLLPYSRLIGYDEFVQDR